MSREHHLGQPYVHHDWDRRREPALMIEPGDVVHFDLPMSAAGQISEDATAENVKLNVSTLYNLVGPIFVKGAREGDTLEIDVVSLRPGQWGWTMIVPDRGLLSEDFPTTQYLKIFDLRDGRRTTLTDGVAVDIRPFLGTMGTIPPDEPEAVSVFPPHRGGGNVDTRHLVVGSTLWLPVWVEGALFSCGDPHAAQGDGEVCINAIECAMSASLRFGLRKNKSSAPSYRTPEGSVDTGAFHGTMGINTDLMEASRAAVRGMIGWLGQEHHLSREDAYILCSVAGDLRIHEIVDGGVWNVGFMLPLSVFEKS